MKEKEKHKKVQSRKKEEGKLKKFFLNDFIWGVFLVVFLSILLSNQFRISFPDYAEGEIALSDIRTPIDLNMPDREATARRTEEAVRAVLPVYDFDSTSSLQVREMVEYAFSNARETLFSYIREEYNYNRNSSDSFEEFLDSSSELENELLDFLEMMEANIPSLDIEMNRQFLRTGFSTDIENAILSVVVNLQKRRIVANLEQLMKSTAIMIRDINSGREEEVRQFDNITGISEIEAVVADSFRKVDNRKLRQSCIEYATHLVHPNITYNKTETERRKESVAALVEEVVLVVKKGTVIARKGDPIDNSVIVKLDAIKEASKTELNPYKLIGLASIFTLLMISVWRYTSTYKTYIKKVRRLYVLVVSVIISSTLIMYFFMFIADSLADKLSVPPFHLAEAYYYGIPIATGAILLTLLVDSNIAIVFAIPFSVIMGVMTGNSMLFLLYSLISSLSAIYGVAHYKQRTALIKTGFIISLFNIATVLALSMFFDKLHPLKDIRETMFAIACGFAGGILSAVLVSFALPLFESLFDILTDIKLLELSSMNNPLLKELATHAPGTYTHSVVVGNLAEAAAEAIGANALFCRVSAYYHDIGKVRMPEYFIENQGPGENKHSDLSPSMSSLIIMNHVKEGLELAKEHNLSRAIQDIIPQHHGTRLISYFYNKAKQNLDSDDAKQVREEDFRYPGPKPQTKEAAIFMLSDAVEAASRTIEEPTSARIKGMIKDVVNTIVLDGQLDECNLTYKDVEKISEKFHVVLLGMMHQRVKYPGFDFDKGSLKKKNGQGRK